MMSFYQKIIDATFPYDKDKEHVQYN